MGFSSSAHFVDGGDLTPWSDCAAAQEGCSMDEEYRIAAFFRRSEMRLVAMSLLLVERTYT